DPADHGLAVDDVTGLSGAEPPANAARIERLLGDGREDLAGLAALLLNAGAAIYVAGLVTSYADGVTRAREVVHAGKGRGALDPADHGLAVDDVTGLSGAEPPANAARIERLLGDGREDLAGLAALLLNAGAAIYVAGLVTSYADGVTRAREVVHAGKGRDALERRRRATRISG